MLTIYIYNCTFLHKNDHDRNKTQVTIATAIQNAHKNVSKLISVHQFVAIFNSNVIYLYSSTYTNHISLPFYNPMLLVTDISI